VGAELNAIYDASDEGVDKAGRMRQMEEGD